MRAHLQGIYMYQVNKDHTFHPLKRGHLSNESTSARSQVDRIPSSGKRKLLLIRTFSSNSCHVLIMAVNQSMPT